LSYFFIMIYTFLVLVYSFRETKRLSGIRNFSLYCLLLCSIIRIIRYAIISDLNVYEQPNEPLTLAIDVLYALPLLILFVAWSLIIMFWIKMSIFIRNPKSGRISTKTLWDWKWLIVFSVLCGVIGAAWLIIILTEINNTYPLVLNIYSGSVLGLGGIVFLSSGCIFSRNLRASSGVSEQKVNSWKRLNTFIIFTSVVVLILVGAIVAISVILLKIPTSKDWFLIRMSIYRVVEQIPIVIMITLYKPSWKELFTGPSSKQLTPVSDTPQEDTNISDT